MIEEADFQKVGNTAIDLCVFVDKLRLGEKHREEADKLTHNVLNLIKQTEKNKEEPLTKGNEMSKKLKIQFWKAEKALAMQILEQEGLPKEKRDGFVRIKDSPALIFKTGVWLRGYHIYGDLKLDSIYFATNTERDAYLQKVVNAITDELFTGKGELKIGEMCEVRDDEDEQWRKRKLITILQEQQSYRFVVDSLERRRYIGYEYARPIIKRTEPTIEECGQLVTYTWEEK